MTTTTTPLLASLYDPDRDECSRCHRDDPCVCGRGPYLELFVYNDEAEAWEFMCNLCGLVLGLGTQHCPEHAPTVIPGLVLERCLAEPAHRRTWQVATDMDDWHGVPCQECMLVQATQEHSGCDHARHGRWRSWKATRRLARVLHFLRLSTGSTFRSGGACGPGCVTRLGWRWSR